MATGRSLRPLLLLAAALLWRASALEDTGSQEGSGRRTLPSQRRRLVQNDVKCKDPICLFCQVPDVCGICDLYADGFPVIQTENGSCIKCTQHPLSSGCDECDSAGRCTACAEDWSMVNGKCVQCAIEGCIDCDPATKTCKLCDMRKGLDARKQCQDCAGKRNEEGWPICLSCDKDYRICTLCENGYYPNAKGVCVKLPEGCLDANATGCTKCEEGLYPDAKGTCSLVPYGCSGANKNGCTGCVEGFYMTPRKECFSCADGCARCTSGNVCTRCFPETVLTPAKTCLSCGFDCGACSFVSPGRVSCTKCKSTTLINGECRRCDDPRCADCPGDVRRCRVCRNKAHRVNTATGRCKDPSWPQPCPQAANGSGGRQGKCGSTPQKPINGGRSTAGRRLQGDADSGTIARRKLIVGGRNATRGRYPYLVSMRNLLEPGNPHFCGGALVHERVVLTAAHCLLNKLRWHEEGLVFSKVRIGGYEQEGGQFEARRVKWAVVHPGAYYTQGHTVNDFALLLLDRPSTTRHLLRLPSALPRPAATVGTPLTAVGWGVDYKYDPNEPVPIEFLPPVLQETVLNMQSLKTCAATFFPREKWDAQFCAGRPGSRSNTCQGDSGGPVIARSNAGPAGDLAVGVVSWGASCDSSYGVLADVAAGSQWIRNATQWMLLEDAAGRIPGPATGPN